MMIFFLPPPPSSSSSSSSASSAIGRYHLWVGSTPDDSGVDGSIGSSALLDRVRHQKSPSRSRRSGRREGRDRHQHQPVPAVAPADLGAGPAVLPHGRNPGRALRGRGQPLVERCHHHPGPGRAGPDPRPGHRRQRPGGHQVPVPDDPRGHRHRSRPGPVDRGHALRRGGQPPARAPAPLPSGDGGLRPGPPPPRPTGGRAVRDRSDRDRPPHLQTRPACPTASTSRPSPSP